MNPTRVKQQALYNPLKTDFKAMLRGDDNQQHEVVMPSRQISYWDVPQANVLKKRLADYIYFQSPMTTAYDTAIDEILHGEDGIEVKI